LYLVEEQFHPKRRYLGGSMPLSEARSVVSAVAKRYRLPPVKLASRDPPPHSRHGGYVDFKHDVYGTLKGATIVRYKGNADWTLNFLLHELAHVIVYVAWPTVQDHGQEFAGVLAWLFDHYRVIPRDALAVIYARYRIKALGLAESSPSALALTRSRKAV
jgi:hypothetical protein